jgi:hypothetical protein
MAMEKLWDLRDVPLDGLADSVEARQLVDSVMEKVTEPSLEVVVAGFNSAI